MNGRGRERQIQQALTIGPASVCFETRTKTGPEDAGAAAATKAEGARSVPPTSSGVATGPAAAARSDQAAPTAS